MLSLLVATPLLNDAKSAPADQVGQIARELDHISEWMTEQFVQEKIQPDEFRNLSERIAHIQAVVNKRQEPTRGPEPASAM
jgi:hypothetical protein